jgi:hypothetical protein
MQASAMMRSGRVRRTDEAKNKRPFAKGESPFLANSASYWC